MLLIVLYLQHTHMERKKISIIVKRSLLLWLLMFTCFFCRGQVGENNRVLETGDTNGMLFLTLCDDYNNKRISDEAFIRLADSLVRTGANSSALPMLLSTYKDIVWGKEKFAVKRPVYFYYMAVYNLNNRDYGGAVFYYRKTIELCNSFKQLRYWLRSYIGLTTIYTDIDDLGKLLDEYLKIAPAINYIINHLSSIPLTKEDLAEVSILLSHGQMAYAAKGAFDPALNNFRKLGRIWAFVNKTDTATLSEEDKVHVRFIGYQYIMARYAMNKLYRRPHDALNDLHAAVAYLSNANTPNEKDARLHIYSELAQFYLFVRNADSAAYYMHLFDDTRSMNNIGRLKKHEQEQRYYSHGFYAEWNEQKGDLSAALTEYKKSSAIRDSIYQAVMMDYYNSLYAKTQAAYDKDQLAKTEREKNKTERFNLILEIFILAVIVAGLLLFYRNKLKQRQAIINSKLNLARNIHDEIGPMLLYTKMLLKAESRSDGLSTYRPELETQISKTLEAVRMLAHELKSEEQYTLLSLSKYLHEQLKKNEKINGISYDLEINNLSQVLSLYQYDHLKKVASELIANTIKHADSDHIKLTIKASGKKLFLVYTDNGKGFSLNQDKGIGINNLEERVQQLKGFFRLENHFPEGYQVKIEIPL